MSGTPTITDPLSSVLPCGSICSSIPGLPCGKLIFSQSNWLNGPFTEPSTGSLKIKRTESVPNHLSVLRHAIIGQFAGEQSSAYKMIAPKIIRPGNNIPNCTYSHLALNELLAVSPVRFGRYSPAVYGNPNLLWAGCRQVTRVLFVWRQYEQTRHVLSAGVISDQVLGVCTTSIQSQTDTSATIIASPGSRVHVFPSRLPLSLHSVSLSFVVCCGKVPGCSSM